MEQEKELGEQRAELTKMRSGRLQQLTKLKNAEKQLCELLMKKPCDVPFGRVPTAQQLVCLQDRVQELECEKVFDVDSRLLFT